MGEKNDENMEKGKRKNIERGQKKNKHGWIIRGEICSGDVSGVSSSECGLDTGSSISFKKSQIPLGQEKMKNLIERCENIRNRR